MKKLYIVYVHITPDGMYYYGVTSQKVERRWGGNGRYYKTTSLYPYIEKFGWDNIQHIVLFKDQTKEDALWIEDFLITTAQEDGVCINKQRSGNISKEEGYKQEHYQQNRDEILEQKRGHYQQNREKILEYQREYNEKNREKILEYQQEYYEQNKDKIREQKKQYREQNKDKIKEQSKQYYEQNKDKIKEQSKQYYEQKREKIREYNRQYYQRKKLEKQLKEVETTPLF